MSLDTASEGQRPQTRPSGRHRLAAESELRLGSGEALLVILLSSLGLWGAIWVAAAALARVLMR